MSERKQNSPYTLNDSYKQTELGPLPQEWEVVRLGEVAKISSGGSAPQGNEYFNGIFPFIRVQHIDLESYSIKNFDLITEDAVKKFKLKLFPKGTIVLPKSGASIYSEKRAILPFDAYVVSHLCTIHTSKKANNLFIYFLLRNKRLAEKKAETYPTLNLSEIENLLIPLPPLHEQKKIAYVLSMVQEAEEKTDRYIQALKELKKSAMKHLFTYGAVPFDEADKVELKETEIGRIPKEWEVVKLSNVIEMCQYGISKKAGRLGKIPMIRMNNMNNGFIIDKNLQFLELDEIEFQKFKLDKGDILFNRTNSIDLVGKTALFNIEGDFVFGSYLIRIKTRKELKPGFLNYYMNWESTKIRIKSLASRAVGQANISASKIKALLIPLAPLHEQQRIASILSGIDEQIEAMENKKKAIRELFNSLLKNLMTAKIRVNNLEVNL